MKILPFFSIAYVLCDPVTPNQRRIVLLHESHTTNCFLLDLTDFSFLYEYLLWKFNIYLQ